MQRWFFLEDPNNALIRTAKEEFQITAKKSVSKYVLRKWLFRVKAFDLRPDEVICVTGNCDTLGQWLPDRCVPLEAEDPEIWSRVIDIPENDTVCFRFCACVVLEGGLQIIVRHWETQLKPRIIVDDDESPTVDKEPLLYGVYGKSEQFKTDRGWVNKETLVHLKLCNNPLTLWRQKYRNRRIFIKVTPVSLQKTSTTVTKTYVEAGEDSLSTDTLETPEEPKHHSFTEVASLFGDDFCFKPQGQFGKELTEDEMLLFQCTILSPSSVAFLIDLYIYSSHFCEGEPPYHVGFSYLLPSAIQPSEGAAVLPVTSIKHRPLGQIRIEYTVIRPMANFQCDMSLSFQTHWSRRRKGLDVGHRGSGSSFNTKNCAEVRENTIASLKNAVDHGADFVEFDVQLSKDMVPIIYHDFHVCIAMKKKRDLEETDMLEIPVKELTHDQLRLLKIYHVTEGKSKRPKYFDEDLEEHQPFPTLKQVLDVLSPHVGFNIEIKWTMQLYDGSYELYHPTDLNLYMDTILEVVMRHGGNRRIIFSCFNADCCSMIRMKQNRYPVMFLTQGETIHYPRYLDPRCWSIKAAAHFARMIEILGINVHTEDLLRDPSLLGYATENDLIIFCWGDDNANEDTIKFVKELGVHGVIFDKIYQYKLSKESIFMVEARESRSALILLAAQTSEMKAQSPPPGPYNGEPCFDMDKVRQDLGDMLSTATSLESLESRSDGEREQCVRPVEL